MDSGNTEDSRICCSMESIGGFYDMRHERKSTIQEMKTKKLQEQLTQAQIMTADLYEQNIQKDATITTLQSAIATLYEGGN